MSSGAKKTLTFSTATLRDQKTLVWLQHQSPSVPWWKWDGVVSSLESYRHWVSCGASVVGVVGVEEVKQLEEEPCGAKKQEKVDAWLGQLYSVAKRVLYVMLPRVCLSWKTEAFWNDNFDNLFILEDLSETYPFLGETWKGTTEDAIHMLSLMGRYYRLVGAGVGKQRPLYDMVVEEETRPAEFVLFTQYYTAKDKKRAKELRECLRRNVKCRWVDRVVLLTERDESVAWASFTGKDKEKIEQHIIGRRLHYSDFFAEVCRRYAEDGKDAVVALANADMYMGEELAEVWRIRWADRAVCLLRWDDLGEGAEKARLFGPRADSQDVWMFSSRSIAERHWSGDRAKETDIPLGVPGCDNAILHTLLQQRFLLSNPALSLKVYHLHNSGVRSYTKADTVVRPVYLHLEPTYLVDTKQEFVPREAPVHICNEVVSFTVKSVSLSDEITYCTMLEKAGRYRWEPMVENYAFEPAIPVYTWRGGAGVTPNGLVYDMYRIYTGRSALQQPEYNYWKKAGIDIFTPMVACSRMAAIPLPDGGVFESWSAYLAFYLSRYLRLCQERSDRGLHFWLPDSFREQCTNEFPTLDVSLGIPWRANRACWAEEVVGFLPGPTGAEIGREEIQALRRAWRGGDSVQRGGSAPLEAKKKRCVVWRGGAFTEEWMRRLEERISQKGWSVESVCGVEEAGKMADASVFLWDCDSESTGEAGQSLWRLPKGAVVVEGQNEMEIQGEGQHMAHMADVEARVLLFRRGSVSDRQEEWDAHLLTLGVFL